MRFICKDCDRSFDDYEVKSYDRETGFEEQVCPFCGSHYFDDAKHCVKCDEDVPLCEMVGSICRECVEKRATLANAYAYAMAVDVDPTEIDGMTKSQARAFCLEDIYDFASFLEGQDD